MTKRLTACLSAALLLGTGLAASAADLARLNELQGDWAVGSGSVFTIDGTSGSLTKVSAADRKAGYAVGDLLIQGLTYRGNVELNSGDVRARYTGTCRSPQAGTGKVRWVVSDCELRLVVPARASAEYMLSNENGSALIASRRTAGGASVAAAPASEAAAPVEDPNETWARRNMSPEELAAQDAGTAKANAQINARNAAIEARNRKAEADYRAALAAREAKILADKQAREKEMADYQARVAAVEAANAAAKAQWEADVAACKRGDRSKCAKKP